MKEDLRNKIIFGIVMTVVLSALGVMIYFQMKLYDDERQKVHERNYHLSVLSLKSEINFFNNRKENKDKDIYEIVLSESDYNFVKMLENLSVEKKELLKLYLKDDKITFEEFNKVFSEVFEKTENYFEENKKEKIANLKEKVYKEIN